MDNNGRIRGIDQNGDGETGPARELWEHRTGLLLMEEKVRRRGRDLDDMGARSLHIPKSIGRL